MPERRPVAIFGLAATQSAPGSVSDVTNRLHVIGSARIRKEREKVAQQLQEEEEEDAV